MKHIAMASTCIIADDARGPVIDPSRMEREISRDRLAGDGPTTFRGRNHTLGSTRCGYGFSGSPSVSELAVREEPASSPAKESRSTREDLRLPQYLP
jgi:hypothetical protein